MTRYSLLYCETQEALEKAKAALAKSEKDRETYRLFIHETGRIPEFMIWWGRREGFCEATMKTLEAALEKAEPIPPANAGGLNE